MTDTSKAATAESLSLPTEPACKHSPPVTANSETHRPIESAPAAVAEKTLTWANPIRVGDCTMQGMSLFLEASGTAEFCATIGSSDDDDAWVIRNGISLIAGNGTVLFTSGKLVSPTCPEDAATGWEADFNFPAGLYDSIASARINDAHC